MPFAAMGVQSTSIQTRLVLVLDEKTGLPVWYSMIPGNVLDLSTLHSTLEDVAESLDIRISSFVLDAGYASREMIQAFCSGDEKGKTMTVRMPAKNGYPYKTLYHQARKLMDNAKYEFIRQGHTYFGKRFETVFKASKEYRNLLPLSKWSDLTVRGRLLSDIISTIALQ